jgi:hypothetical protein
MYSIDLILKDTSLPISVQRKEKEDAESLYQEIKSAIEFRSKQLLELTSEKEEERKITVLVENIVAVSIAKKSGSSIRSPGFFNLNQENE